MKTYVVSSRYLILSAFVAFATGPSVAIASETLQEPIEAEVVRVIDGDTMDVLGRFPPHHEAKVVVRVQVVGIDAPEAQFGECDREHARGRVVRDRVVDLVGDDPMVTLRGVEKSESPGHRSARVFLSDGRDLGALLIRERLAVPYDGDHLPDWCPIPVIE